MCYYLTRYSNTPLEYMKDYEREREREWERERERITVKTTALN